MKPSDASLAKSGPKSSDSEHEKEREVTSVCHAEILLTDQKRGTLEGKGGRDVPSLLLLLLH